VKITLYTEKLYDNHSEITDPKQLAKLIKETISHLGKFIIYYDQPYNSFQRKFRRFFGIYD